MESFGKAHVPYGVDGEGNYFLNTNNSLAVIENATNDILTNIDLIPVSSGLGSPFVICDFGTADGGISMKLLDQMIERIRQKHPKKEILIRYEDQPNNDYKSLFFHTQGINQVTDFHGEVIVPYLSKHKDVFVTCCGTSFYEQCFPSNSAHFVMSSTAMHWLSRIPCHIPNGIHPMQALPGSPEALEFQKQAQKDWVTILVNRGKELCCGGRFFLINFCNEYRHKQFDTFNDTWSKMRDESVITNDEYINTTFHEYFRSKEEVREPFDDPNSEVSKLGLRLISLETHITPCPYNAYWNSSECTLSPDEYAKMFVRNLRSWSNSIFMSSLSSKRMLKEREGIVDQLFDRIYDCVAAKPRNFALDFPNHFIVIEKVA